jgi:hypothetical protein
MMEAVRKSVMSANFYQTIPSSALKMETECFSESLASTDESTRRQNTEHRHRRENFKSHKAEDIFIRFYERMAEDISVQF